MLIDPLGRFVISSLGWIDKGSLWILDTSNGEVKTHQISKANYLTLHAGTGVSFAVKHHFDDGSAQITVHTFDNPASILASCTINQGCCTVYGDCKNWSNVPKHYVAYIKESDNADFALLTIQESGEATTSRFDWFGDTYDKGYQGIIGVIEVPESDLILISVQRSSKIIICNLNGKKKGEFELANAFGNPRLQFRKIGSELWADDYDTLLVLEAGTWRILRSRRLQDARNGTAQFIGQYSFTADGNYCCVSRPFSGDVLMLDPVTLKTRYRAKLNSQPLEAVMMSDRKVYARDWKTGDLLSGNASRVWFN